MNRLVERLKLRPNYDGDSGSDDGIVVGITKPIFCPHNYGNRGESHTAVVFHDLQFWSLQCEEVSARKDAQDIDNHSLPLAIPTPIFLKLFEWLNLA